jgi:hypothetical protein
VTYKQVGSTEKIMLTAQRAIRVMVIAFPWALAKRRSGWLGALLPEGFCAIFAQLGVREGQVVDRVGLACESVAGVPTGYWGMSESGSMVPTTQGSHKDFSVGRPAWC